MPGYSGRFAVTRVAKRSLALLVFGLLLAAAAGGTAQARVVMLHGQVYGELPKPGALGGAAPPTVGGPQPPVVYGGGPLMLSSKLYLIFWGPSGSFAPSYYAPITQYAMGLQTDRARTTNEFSIGQTYKNGGGHFVTSNVTYGGRVFDTTKYPALDKSGGCIASQAPCLTDPQLQNEIINQINNQGWPSDPAGSPVAQYLIFTPNGVNSCDGPGSCTFTANGFCAYHSQITFSDNTVATYSNLPYQSGCDSGQAPTGTDGNADTDGTLDSLIHELTESVTDPSNGTGYTDSNGNEVGDKCTGPVVNTQPAIYGPPLGGSLSALNAYNQLIGGHTYYTQQIWVQAPTKTPATTAAAGCVQRIGPSPSFTGPTTAHPGVKVAFSGKASSEVQRPITSYVWNYGDGSATTSGVLGSHTYTRTGSFTVTLTVTDATGAVNATSERRVIKVS